uniref:Protein phosphatase type 2c n=1 Tax=Riptortus pedestris TaxID=329032 RepID=R4WRP8_RIPPE|nr:protein phosphatase type 2c [Riptortus pedestris]
MEDELEDRIFYQSYVTHMKLISKFLVGLPLNSSHFSHFWRLLRFYLLKPEVLFIGGILIIVFIYIQAVEVWSRSFVSKLRLSLGRSAQSRIQKAQFLNGDVDGTTWDFQEEYVAVYAVQGRRPKMEDRFIINKNINGTGVSLFAVFDGHGGEFAANYAHEHLVNNLSNKVIELKHLISKGVPEKVVVGKPPPSPKPVLRKTIILDRKPSIKKGSTDAEEALKKAGGPLSELEKKLESIPRAITREVKPIKGSPTPFQTPELSTYLEGNTINYGRLLTDEVLAVDRLLVESAKKNMDVAGTTALIALMEGSKLIVANVGDSRGVMCNNKGKAIPLSFDHKPQQTREKKRIEEAGGSVSFNGVWRVAGILATSRALGDYPLKDRKLVIADPDILTFELGDHRPEFIVLASDGLWDTFSNEEAVAFIRSRLNEPHFGAKSITLQSYHRGSLDNITVLVINLRDYKWS